MRAEIPLGLSTRSFWVIGRAIMIATLIPLVSSPAALAAVYEITAVIDPEAGTIEVDGEVSGYGGELAFASQEITIVSDGVRNGQPYTQWRLVLQSGASDAALMSPEGGYLFGHADWLPQTADKRSTYRLTLRISDNYRAIATGTLKNELTDAGVYESVFHYQSLDEFPSIFFGRYEIDEKSFGDMTLRTYFEPEYAGLAADYLVSMQRYIAQFSEQIGDYPYQNFSVVSAPIPVGLGFDSLTYISSSILSHPYMRGRSLAHEILHSWWGNAVGVDYDRGNWAEGLTTFMADYGLAEQRSAEAARDMRLEWLRNLKALPPERDTPANQFRSKTHDAAQVVGYDKIALMFYMLRRQIGEAAFAQAIRDFWQTYRFERAGWQDIEAKFSAAAGDDLAWFFDQWLTRPGLPELSLKDWRIVDEDVELTLAQSGPAYRLSVPVEIDYGDRAVAETFEMSDPEITIQLKGAARATSIRIDPDFEIARTLLRDESAAIFRDITLSPRARLLVAGTVSSEEATKIATIASALLRRQVETATADQLGEPTTPLLVIGRTDDVAAVRDQFLPGQAPDLSTDGDHRAWAERAPDGRHWLFVSTDTIDDAEKALYPLRYYSHRSFAVLDDDGNESGVWPATRNPLVVQLN